VRRVGAAYVTFCPFAGWSDDSDRMLRIVARDDEGPVKSVGVVFDG
jgi:hypothetical protein